MSRIRNRDTSPETIVRKGLHGRGYRYRLHDKKLPGRPDVVLPKYHAVLNTNGCFWHGHDCHLFRLPKTRRCFWEKKIRRTMLRDDSNQELLTQMGWRVAVVWECALRGKTRQSIDEVIENLDSWLRANIRFTEIRGK